MAFFRLTFLILVTSRTAPVRSAPSRFDVDRSASKKFAPLSLALLKFAPRIRDVWKLLFVRSCPLKSFPSYITPRVTPFLLPDSFTAKTMFSVFATRDKRGVGSKKKGHIAHMQEERDEDDKTFRNGNNCNRSFWECN
eukprot:CAMPEP_0184349012 /NCGR_PEP_ID=MMETSP1089-20130417/32106_1 /TAXON_ID=38269 ORGANISM="Gloeochaete wittrockiana, Strain SAG46.84" /NCGR_SAMPLE_ID=MMETSP1089 /ASSEMBLY_ACC=CAM_ASM_000445 /LENGTH=137 /DNA_ID=CAMNT_0026681041 /DNA_START=339 /DNA_END=752 /DNA_ORIENTATION=+